jgi:hypothetical protein
MLNRSKTKIRSLFKGKHILTTHHFFSILSLKTQTQEMIHCKELHDVQARTRDKFNESFSIYGQRAR